MGRTHTDKERKRQRERERERERKRERERESEREMEIHFSYFQVFICVATTSLHHLLTTSSHHLHTIFLHHLHTTSFHHLHSTSITCPNFSSSSLPLRKRATFLVSNFMNTTENFTPPLPHTSPSSSPHFYPSHPHPLSHSSRGKQGGRGRQGGKHDNPTHVHQI
ncbi:hypothetical protein FHG87_015457 [Trinorchestia longiramus]|nr:hypothetical protein FHG87_015457 [Trinorchestia longiramus]